MIPRRRGAARSAIRLSALTFLVAIVVDGVLRLSEDDAPVRTAAAATTAAVGGAGGGFLRRLAIALGGDDGGGRGQEEEEEGGDDARGDRRQDGLREGREFLRDRGGPTAGGRRRRRRRAYDVPPPSSDEVRGDYYDNDEYGRSLLGAAGGDDAHYEADALYQGYGTHYIDLYVGSPVPQRQTVIVDTGSSVTSFPCTGCDGCGATSDFGAVSSGKSYHTDDVTGLFRTQLEDGIMGMDNRKGAFWLQVREHYERMGYGGGDDDDEGGEGDEEGGSFDPSRFSLCYDRKPLSQDLRSGVGSGALTLGGSDPLLHDTPMVYASNVTPDGGWYNVRVRAAFLRKNGGTLISGPVTSTTPANDVVVDDARYLRVHASEDALNGGVAGVIIDSGTTDTYLPHALLEPFEKAWEEALGGTGVMGKYDNDPREMTPEEVRSLPTILLVLRGHEQSNAVNVENAVVGMTRSHADMFPSDNNLPEEDPVSDVDVVVAIPPEHYMEESSQLPGLYTSRVYFTERYMAQPILGSNFLMGHEVLFDNGLGRIGFAESHCDYSRYVEERDASRQRDEERQQQQGEELKVEDDAVEPHEAKSDLAASGWARR
ncbi:hypothetical protein ACHAW5_007137 [Stephanodiscus triporus]|uniref:Peptidase A1 domain-containing protein n=1 Tax=Stephanodiscus triporus TaxID=2934178 RepID=A0ABD3QYJ1_9STRA